MNELKSRCFKFFKNWKFKQAILGTDGIYIKDPTWGNHDTLTVFLYILEWTADKKDIDMIKQELEAVLKDILFSNKAVAKIDNGLISINVIRSYCIAANEENYWPIEKDYLEKLLVEFYNQLSLEEINSKNIKRDIELLRKYLPNISI